MLIQHAHNECDNREKALGGTMNVRPEFNSIPL